MSGPNPKLLPGIPSRCLPWILTVLLAAGYSFPLIASLWLGASPLTIANESIAYRFLFSERLLNGEGASIWVLAGFLTTAIQTTILAVINLFIPSSPGALSTRLDVYAYLFSGLVTVTGVALLAGIARARTLPVTRLALGGLAAVGPLFLTDTGFYYFTLPDYYHLNILLSLALVVCFQSIWFRETSTEGPGTPWTTITLVALLVGAAAANKITLLPLGGTVIVAMLLMPRLRWPRLVGQSALTGIAVAAGFIFVVWWFYLFKAGAMMDMFGAWSTYVSNPGGESDFWQKFRQYLVSSSYGFIIGVYLVSWLIGAGFGLQVRGRRVVTSIVLLVILLAGVTWSYFVYKRPAGTTFFEAISALLALAACSLTVAAHRRAGRLAIAVVILICAAYGAQNFGWKKHLGTLRESGPWAENMWRLHNDLVRFAAGRPIVVVHPQNHYGYGGVAEFLIKGTADVPIWNISANGEPILHRYLPGATFRHEYGGTNPNVAYPRNAVVFWVDRPEFKPMTELFPGLALAVNQPGAIRREWRLPISGGRVKLVGHAVQLPDTLPKEHLAALATPIKITLAVRNDAANLTIYWTPDPLCQVELEFAETGGTYMALGKADPGTDGYILRSLTGGRTYVVRMRKVVQNESGPWLELPFPSDKP